MTVKDRLLSLIRPPAEDRPLIEPDDNPYASQLFARGYIARSDAPPKAPPGWGRTTFANLHISHDLRLAVRHSRTSGTEILCFGLLFDVREPTRSTNDYLQLLVRLLEKDETDFLFDLKYTCGRYVCLYRSNLVDPTVVTDATGMKPAFYYAGSSINISSHVELIARNEPQAARAVPLTFRYGYPGLRTPRMGVRRLTPNTKLDVCTLQVKRFWPIHKLQEKTLSDATNIVMSNLSNSIEYVAKVATPLISVTAGLDSRTTLSVSRAFRNARYFTYFSKRKSLRIDIDFCRRLSMNCLIDIDQIPIADSEPDPKFCEILRENTVGAHSTRLAWEYYNKFPHDGSLVHVRSNVAETGREFWKSKLFKVSSPVDLARIYLNDRGNLESETVFRIIDCFTELDKYTGIFGCQDLVDLKSLFYWEFRMGAWHSQVVAESDPAFDTVSLFNCRHTLETMLSVNREHREAGDIQKQIIMRAWPELATYPINGKPFQVRRTEE